MYSICLIPGDGIGLEVVPAAREVLEATGVALSFETAEAGWAAFKAHGSSVPAATTELARASNATLVGALESPSRKVEGFTGAIRVLRRQLGLYANLRPAKSRPIAASRSDIDILMVRENTEGLYSGAERRYGNTAIADAVVTKEASERIAKVAVEHARRRSGRMHIVHKANVLNLTSGLFLETVRAVAEADGDLDVRDVIVDVAALRLVTEPERFDVMVTTNLFGDILSDLTAGLVGGLGLAPSANLGTNHALFEPVHGTAPDIAGKGIANPMATILAAALMLGYLGEADAANRVEKAVEFVLREGPVTPDLGGAGTTQSVTEAVIAALG
jgi:homoisocitrate dehydrogenase